MASNQWQPSAESAATSVHESIAELDKSAQLAVLTIDDRGMVRDCDHGGEALFKYRRSELVWRHVSILLPQLATLDLMQNGQPNPRLRFLCRIGHHLQAVTHDGEHFASEIFVNVLDNKTGQGRLVLIVRRVEETCCDGTSSPGADRIEQEFQPIGRSA